MNYSHKRSDERIKRLMDRLGMPHSMSLQQAMKQLEMEVRLEVEKEFEDTAHTDDRIKWEWLAP